MGEQKTKHTSYDLAQMQSLPLEQKVIMSQRRIQEWYDYWDGQVYVSFSGGKDSTVLLDIVRKMYPDVPAVFVNTGLEYPEIQAFVKEHENVTVLCPKMRFDEVIRRFGYPCISKEVSHKLYYAQRGSGWAIRDLNAVNVDGSHSKFKASHYAKYKPMADLPISFSHKCCDVMKKNPAKDFEKKYGKKPIVATMASESRLRQTQWLNKGCNAFDSKRQISAPMSFWTEQDILQYIKQNGIPIASVYGDIVYNNDGKLYTTGCNRTGCIFCAFGCHLDKEPSRFQRLKQTHPRQYEYCIGGGGYDEHGIWKPSNDGLGMKHVFDELNKLYGDVFIKYKEATNDTRRSNKKEHHAE